MSITSIRNPKSPISEAYRSIRTSIDFSGIDKKVKTILVTSGQKNEGKSTTIANLAASFGMLDNKKVLLVDCDLRNPSTHKMFGLSNTLGLTDIIRGNKTLLECLAKTEIQNLHLLPAGQMPPNPSEILSSDKMKGFIEELKDYYDYVFIDAPPIGIVTDAGILASVVDGVVLVTAANEAEIQLTKIAKSKLEQVEANILGVVLNKYEATGNSYYNYYYEEDSRTNRKSKKGRSKRLAKA